MKKILVVLLSIFCFTKVYAYENNYFKIDIPDNYIEESSENNVYKWENKNNNHENIIITISKNTNHNIDNYTDDDIVKYEEYIESEINDKLENYKFKVDVKNVRKEKINEINSLIYETYWPTKDLVGYDTYQKGYSFTTNNYIYVCTFTSDKAISNDESIIKSFKLLDKNISKYNPGYKEVIIASLIFGIFFVIIALIKKRKSKK